MIYTTIIVKVFYLLFLIFFFPAKITAHNGSVFMYTINSHELYIYMLNASLTVAACLWGCKGRLEAVDSRERGGRRGNVVLLQTSSGGWAQRDKIIGGQRGGGGGGGGGRGVLLFWDGA